MRTAAPLPIVAFGGGTGLPVLLAGLRERPDVAITAVVTVADDGGSSGRLRREFGVPPPGDVRNCLAALARDRRLADALGRPRGDHPLGNLLLTAVTEVSGDFCAGIRGVAGLVDAHGAVYPAAVEPISLVLHAADGTAVRGESAVSALAGALARVEPAAPGAPAPPSVLAAVESAAVVVLAAGSLFTSTIAAMLGGGTREALAGFAGPVVYVGNLMTQPGETTGFTVADHVRAIAVHAGPAVTDVLVPADRPSAAVLRRYADRGAAPVEVDEPALARLGVSVTRAPLIAAGTARHDAARLAEAVLDVSAARRRSAAAPERSAHRLARRP